MLSDDGRSIGRWKRLQARLLDLEARRCSRNDARKNRVIVFVRSEVCRRSPRRYVRGQRPNPICSACIGRNAQTGGQIQDAQR